MGVMCNRLSELSIGVAGMDYFDDIEFLDGDTMRRCTTHIDHRWPSTYHLQMLQSGGIYYAVDDGEAAEIRAPTVFWHHPRHRYRYGPLKKTGWHHHYFIIRGERARRIFEGGFMTLSPDCRREVRHAADFASVFRAIIRIVHAPGEAAQANAVVLLERLLAMLGALGNDSLATACDPRICRLGERVRKRPGEDYDFKEIADDMGMSYSHFRRLFRSAMSRPPHDYLLACRMREVAREIRSSRRQIKDIALSHGYEAPAQFSKLFKSKIGLSPQQYRLATPYCGR